MVNTITRTFGIALIVCILASLTTVMVTGQETVAANSAEIMLQARTFVPQTSAPLAERTSAWHGIVQFHTLPTAAERSELEAAGVIFHSYIPKNSWLATLPANAAQLSARANVRWIGELLPTDKYDAALFAQVARVDAAPTVDITLFADANAADMQRALLAAGGELLAINGNVATVKLPLQLLQQAAQLDGVRWIDPALPTASPFTDMSTVVTTADAVQEAPYGLTGAGTTLAMWDLGVPDPDHGDFAGRLIYDSSRPIKGHASNVAGIMAGSGAESEAAGLAPLAHKGYAPAATIIANDYARISVSMDDAVNLHGADVLQNSWGYIYCWNLGGYAWNADYYDGIVNGDAGRIVPVVFAAANMRNMADCDGPYGTIPTGPQIAKNVITVGGTNDNDNFAGSNSSWGPTNDGRLKPEVVAPGVGIKGPAVGGGYLGFSGSSQAAPAVSGSIGLITERYRTVCAGVSATDNLAPATLRALIAHTADDLADNSTEMNVGPDFATGYGRLNVKAAIDMMPNHIVGRLSNGETADYIATVAAGETSLKVTLAWDDPAAAANAAIALINDLDLELIAPDGTAHGVWVLDPTAGNESNPATRSSGATLVRDQLNVLEQVVVDNPMAGDWTIRVLGSSVPEGPQSFSLISADATQQDCALTNLPLSVELLQPTDTDNVIGDMVIEAQVINASMAPESIVDVSYSIDAGAPIAMAQNGDSYTATFDTTTLNNGNHVLRIFAAGQDDSTSELAVDITVNNELEPTSIQLDSAQAAPTPPQPQLNILLFLALLFMGASASIFLVFGRKPAN